MPNISLLSILIIIILILSAGNPVYCQDQTNNSNNFSLGTFFGAVYGHSEELVYPYSEPAELLSELLWDMKPILYAGFQVDYGRASIMKSPGVFASLVFKAGIPGDSGTMENRDWQSLTNTSLSDFSTHTNRTKEFIWIDLNIGASIPFKYIYLKPFISGSWMHFAFSARNGYGTYRVFECSKNCTLSYKAPDCTVDHENSFPRIASFEGQEVITYRQDWLLIALGISAGTNILFPLCIDLTFQISPFTYCAAEDQHLGRNTTFLDFTGWGLFIEPKINISLCLERFDFSLEASYRSIGRTSGDSYSRASSSSGPFGLLLNKTGAALSLFDARFLVRIWF